MCTTCTERKAAMPNRRHEAVVQRLHLKILATFRYHQEQFQKAARVSLYYTVRLRPKPWQEIRVDYCLGGTAVK